MTTMYLISFFAVVIALAFAAYLAMWVKRQNLGNARIEEVGKLIRDGANTFMRREYKLLACFAGVVAVLILLFLPKPFWVEGANFLDNEPGKDGVSYIKRSAVCLETQYYPDAVHHENFPGPICKKGEKYDTRTAYRFLTQG